MAQVYQSLGKRRFLKLALSGSVFLLGVAAVGCSPSETAAQSYEARLARHLTEVDATMYGAFWCPHCGDQKAMFGDAVEAVPYVECDPEGENAQPQVCRDKNIEGYPTWEINGELYTGTQTLDELARLSGFEEE